MTTLHYIFDSIAIDDLPASFVGVYTVSHPLVEKAAHYLQHNILNGMAADAQFQRSGHGKMFGVLVVKDDGGRIGALFAFTDQLGGEWQVPGFVPPIFTSQSNSIPLTCSREPFQGATDYSCYVLSNSIKEEMSIAEIMQDKPVFAGTGNCASTKLVYYAIQHNYKPIAMAEFWWGAMPEDEVRHHGMFYPPCRGRCLPLISFMLEGLDVEPAPNPVSNYDDSYPRIIYEDNDLIAVDKPPGMLSVPGKSITDSVQTRMKNRYPECDELILLHRLDMSTSGLLLLAKNKRAHKALQNQFMKKTIEKRYVALLSRIPDATSGLIELPLRVDLCDRPRQLVCYKYGKPATTYWELLAQEDEKARVYFFPKTGRTHQLRVHAAHSKGLNAPIVGDELYGTQADRLYLHAEQLRFVHPTSGKCIELCSSVPF